MKTLLLALFLLVACLSGCTSVPSANTAGNIDAYALGAKLAIQNVVSPVLVKNPSYEPALLAVADGIDAGILQKSIVSPEIVKAFLDGIAQKHPIDAATQYQVSNAILDTYEVYVAAFPAGTVTLGDPNVVKLAQGFSAGIKTGIQRYHVLIPVPR